MGDLTEPSNKLEESAAVELTGGILVVTIIVLFVVVVFVVFLHLYAKWYWRRVQQDGGNTTRRRPHRRLDFAANHRELAAVTGLRHGLDPSVLKSIPVIKFSPQDFKDGLECSVCLSEVSEGERARLLPRCNHGFHVECIDMWFQSHSTCPLCRNPVPSTPESLQEITHNTPAAAAAAADDSSAAGVGVSSESLNIPTNVLFWGNETRVSNLGSCLEDGHQSVVTSSSSVSTSTGSGNMSDGHLVIDIPRQINEEEDQKSPAPTRLRSLKRLLSRDRKINPSSGTNVDVE